MTTNLKRRAQLEKLLAERGLMPTDVCYSGHPAGGDVCSGWFFDADAGRATRCDECATYLRIEDLRKWADYVERVEEDHADPMTPADGFTDDDAHQLWLDETVELIATLKLTKAQRAQFEWLGLRREP